MPLWINTLNQEVNYQLIKSITYCFILFNVHICVYINCSIILISTAYILNSFLLCWSNFSTQCFQSCKFLHCYSYLVFSSLSCFHRDNFSLLGFEQSNIFRLCVGTIDRSGGCCRGCLGFRLGLFLLLLWLFLSLGLYLLDWLGLLGFSSRCLEFHLGLDFFLFRAKAEHFRGVFA